MLVACSGGEGEDSAEQDNAQWNEIQSLKSQLDANRAELQDLRDQLAAADAAEPEEAPAEDAEGGDDAAAPAMTPEELQAKIDEMGSAISAETDALYGRVVDLINNSGLVEGAELTPDQQKAFGLKADIDIIYAQEYIDRGGDYQRAIDIYSQALRSDPTNEKLLNAKAEAERLQHMDEERFSAVKKGMTQAEVRGLLGTVKNTNVREFTEQNRIGWFYRKEDGGAAGVYFREKTQGSDDWIVEISDFDAIKPPSTEESEDAG
ncbi:MAG: hypothetical protein AAFX50_04405 [Acidobacteriota bacterium]